MPRQKDFKRRVRTRMARTGERYTEARQGLTVGEDQFNWHLAGSHRQAYELTQAGDPRHPGAVIQMLRCTGDAGGGFGTVMTSVDAADYRRRRVRCAGEVRADSVTEWSGLWMRVDGKEQGDTLGFDNMQDRPLKGTFDWRRVAVVLDVPSEANRLAFGVLLQGRGAVQLADVRLQPVGADVAVTGTGLPGGWTLGGSARGAYEASVENRAAPDQASSAYLLRSSGSAGEGFETLARSTPAARFRGRRLRLAAMLKGQDVQPWTGLWMRVDGPDQQTLAFDNMYDRGLRGTFDWTPVEVVLDVAEEALWIPYGVLLAGQGTVHAANIRLEPVEPDTPTTGRPSPTSGWMISGSRPEAYELVVVEDAHEPGRRAAILRTASDPTGGFGAVAQVLHAANYRAGTVRFSASLDGVEGEARSVLWLRVDRNSEQVALVNQPDPPLQGLFAPRRVEAVLPVSADATAIAFGVVLSGVGAVRIRDARFDVVGEEGRIHEPWPNGPEDLGFERGASRA